MKAFESSGAKVKNVVLEDAPGARLRAELGKMVGRTPVPFIFIGGKYIGGYDGGTGEEAPGLVDVAFKGDLVPRLKKAGAL